jgi:hypothetical protein
METKTSSKKYTAQDFYTLFAGLVPANILPYIVAQVAHETADFKSKLLYDHNNASGIVFANKPALQKNATKGRVLPEDSRYNYAKFATLKDWAVDYIRIINRGKNKPLAAPTVEEYVNRLKANGFFTATLESYLTGVKKFMKKYSKLTPATTGGGVAIILVLVAVALLVK